MSSRLEMPTVAAAKRTFLLADWTAVRGGSSVSDVVQSAEVWLDVASFADATFWIQCSEVALPSGGLIVLQLETSPTNDESCFQTVAGPIILQAGATPVVVKTASSGTVPLGRFIRWHVLSTGSGAWDATFQIRVTANRARYFGPPDLGGCMFWCRPDLGLTFSGTSVTKWADWSGLNQFQRTLVAGSVPPTATAADSLYANQATLQFSGNNNCYFASGTWPAALSQPVTCVIVAHRVSGTPDEWVMDGTGSSRFGAGQTTGIAGQLTMFAGGNVSVSSTPWTSPAAWLGEYDTTSSNLFFNNFTTASASGSVGADTLNGLILANYGGTLTTPWNGTIAEAMIFKGLLSTNQKQRLKQYLNSRYALGIV